MQWPSAEEVNAMTLQVGLVGVDGLVVASDTLLQQVERSRSTGSISKFFKDIPGLICCYSGDTVAEGAASRIRRLWRDNPPAPETVQDELERIGEEAWVEHNEHAARRGQPLNLGVARKVMVACYDELWLLEIGPHSLAHRRPDRVVAGDAENTAKHFINKFGTGCEHLPVNHLIMLAAYAVIVAGEENPYGVGGLEVIVIPKGGQPVILTSDQNDELRKLSRNLDALIKENLTSRFSLGS